MNIKVLVLFSFPPSNVDNGGLRERDVFAMWVSYGLGRKVSCI